MASPQAEAVKDQLRAIRVQLIDDEPTLEERRAAAEAFALAAEPEGVRYELVDAGGIPAMWVVPDGAPADAALQYLHGGGYVVCSLETHRCLVGHIAKAAGVRVLHVDYGLAPENPHPGPVNDSVQAYRWLLAQGLAPERLAVAGDSAGGGLTLATLLALRDQGVALPATAVALSPWIDLEGTGDSMTSRAELDLIVSPGALKVMTDYFLAGSDPRDPLAAPLHADLTGLPPLYVQVGDEETLLDDSTRLAAKAAEAGVEVRLDVFPEMQHVFQMLAGVAPEADDAVARIGVWLRERLAL